MNYRDADSYTIIELHAGRLAMEWDDIAECAAWHHVHPATIKELIYTGNPLPSSLKQITFDLDPDCNWDVVRTASIGGPVQRRSAYRLVRHVPGRKPS